MIELRHALAVCTACVFLTSGTVAVRAEDAALPVPVMPQRLQVSVQPAPIDMRAEDADKLIKQMKTVPFGLAPGSPKAGSGTAGQSAGGVSRTIKVPAPEVVNKSANFQFRDATERSKSAPAVRSISERRAAVEAYRQSLSNEHK